jgi:hypothetical protein
MTDDEEIARFIAEHGVTHVPPATSSSNVTLVYKNDLIADQTRKRKQRGFGGNGRSRGMRQIRARRAVLDK